MTRHEEILTAAARLFHEQGYPETGMRDIASEVGLSVSSLYNHVTGKEAILKEICFAYAERFIIGMENIVLEGESPSQQLKQLLNLHLNIAREDPASVLAFDNSWQHLPKQDLLEFLALRQTYENRFREIIRSGIASSEIRPLSDRLIFNVLLTGVRQLYERKPFGADLPPETYLQELHELLLHGVLL